jgi:hypothetical protein
VTAPAALGRRALAGRRVLAHLLELEIIDRSLVVGAQAFSALIPLIRGTGWGLLWIAFIAAYWAVVPGIDHDLPAPLGAVTALAVSFVLWLVTPYVLLARRVPWRVLVPQAGLSAAGMTILGAAAVISAPHAISTSAAEFGVIGVAFTLLSLLWAGGFVLVTAAAIGSYLTLPAWSRASPGSVTPPPSSSSPVPGS